MQFSRGESTESLPSSLYGDAEGDTAHVWSFQVAGGPTYQVREDLAVYGGLFYDMLHAEFNHWMEIGM